MEKNAFNASWILLYIGREANLLFKAVNVLGVVSNQLASIAQVTDEMVCLRGIGVLSNLSHLGYTFVEEGLSFRI
jgi:uncharacterized membrane protein